MSIYSLDTQARKTLIHSTTQSLGIIGLSMTIAIVLHLIYHIPAYAQPILQDYVLYSTNATQIQVVPLVTTGIPDLTTGITVTASASCESDLALPAYSKILPVTGEWVTIWHWDAPCYSRFSANSSGGYDEQPLGTWPADWAIRGVDDVDEDGLDDLLLGHRVSPSGDSDYQYRVALGQPDGSFGFSATPVTYANNQWASQLMLADANNDGNSDIVYFNFSSGGTHNTTLQMHVGNGDGTFNTTPQPVFISPHGANGIAFADFDEDNDLDIYLPPDDDVSDMGQSHFALNIGNDYLLQESLDFRPSDEDGTSGTFWASAVAYDVNLDNHMDLVTYQSVWNGGPHTTEIYWGDGTGNFTPTSTVVLSGFNTGDPYTPRLEWGPLNRETQNATLYVDASPMTLTVGVPHTLTIMVDSTNTEANGVLVHGQVDLNYLQIMDIQADTSVFDTVIMNPTYDEVTGVFTYAAGSTLGTTTSSVFPVLTMVVTPLQTTTMTGTVVTFSSDYPPTDISGPTGSVLSGTQDGIIHIQGGIFHGEINFYARPDKPNPAWQEDIYVAFYPANTVDYVNTTPIYTATTSTDANGQFSLTTNLVGSFDIEVEAEQTLPRVEQDVTLVAGYNFHYFAIPPAEGDIDDDNVISIRDYGLLSASFNLCEGDSGFNPDADLNKDGCVDIKDLGLLLGNFLMQWPLIVVSAAHVDIDPHRVDSGATAQLGFDHDTVYAKAGEVVTLTLYVDPNQSAVNGVTASLDYDPNALEIVDVMLTEHMPLEMAKEIDHANGRIVLSGGIFNQTHYERFAFATVQVRMLTDITNTTITPVVDEFPQTDVVGPTGSVLERVNDVTLTTSTSLYLPIVTR